MSEVANRPGTALGDFVDAYGRTISLAPFHPRTVMQADSDADGYGFTNLGKLGGALRTSPNIDDLTEWWMDEQGYLRGQASAPKVAFHVGIYGAVADAREITGSAVDNSLTTDEDEFTEDDVGKYVLLNPGSADHQIVRIASYSDARQVLLEDEVENPFDDKRCAVGTDNVAAFAAAYTAAATNIGGYVALGAGNYLLASSGSLSTANNGVLVVPDSTYNGMPVYFEGALPAPMLFNDYAQDPALPWPGTIVYCASLGSGDSPAIFKPYRTDDAIDDGFLSHTSLRFRNILFRSPVDRTCDIVDWRYGGGFKFKDCSFDTDFDDFHIFPVPTRGKAAVRFPITGNTSECVGEDGAIVGYGVGVDGSEHLVLSRINIFNNVSGLFVRAGTGVKLENVHFNENHYQIEVDPDSDNAAVFGHVNLECPQGAGGNNLFNTKQVIRHSRVGASPEKYLAGELRGYLTVPGQNIDYTPAGQTETLRESLNCPNLQRLLIGPSIETSVTSLHGLIYSGDADERAMIPLGDSTREGGMPFTTVGFKLGHATLNTGMFCTEGGGAGCVLMYVPGQNKFYISSLAGGAFDATRILCLQPAGRVIIGDAAAADDSSSTLCIGGEVVIAEADGEGHLRLGDGQLMKGSGSGFEMNSTLKITDGGNIEMTTVGSGVVQKSANGTRYRIVIANDGTLSTTPA